MHAILIIMAYLFECLSVVMSLLLLKNALISLSSLSLCSRGDGTASIGITLGPLIEHAVNTGIYSHGHFIVTSPIHLRMHILSLFD